MELNLDVMDDAFAHQADGWLKGLIQTDCEQITNAKIGTYSLWDRFLQWTSYEVYRLLFLVFTFYFREQKQD